MFGMIKEPLNLSAMQLKKIFFEKDFRNGQKRRSFLKLPGKWQLFYFIQQEKYLCCLLSQLHSVLYATKQS
jgi:hypothetical protein